MTELRPEPLVPAGAAFFALPKAAGTESYAFILVPGFTLLAFASAVEPLRIANQISQQPLYCLSIWSATGAPVQSSSGIPVGVEGSIPAFERITKVFVCAGNPALAATAPEVATTLHRHHRHGGTVGGICTGTVALASAGLLEGRRFTLHWENQPAFCEAFPELSPTANKFEKDGRVITCGGGAASTDMMLSVIASDHGEAFAAMVADMCLRTVMPEEASGQRSSLSALLASRNSALVSAVRQMMVNLATPLSMDEIAAATGSSLRHIERLFQTTTGSSPAKFYRDLRLDRARNLLSATDMMPAEIAEDCGFDTVSHFAKSFRSRFGMPPSRIRAPRVTG